MTAILALDNSLTNSDSYSMALWLAGSFELKRIVQLMTTGVVAVAIHFDSRNRCSLEGKTPDSLDCLSMAAKDSRLDAGLE